MRRHISYSEQLEDDGPEIEFEFEPIDGTLLQKKCGDRYVVAYLVYDSDGSSSCNPLKEYDGNGELITERQGVITDGDVCTHLGLEEFGGRFSGANKDYELDGIEEQVRAELNEIIRAEESLRVWFVKLRLELNEDPMPRIIDYLQGYWSPVEWEDEDRKHLDSLPSWESLAENAWDKLYAQGKIGTYLAVPVNYCDNAHGPGTTRIHTTDLDSANAVWVPGTLEIDNMNFDDCTTYLDKLAVAAKYAQSCLDEYEKWCNGEVFGRVVQWHDESGALIDSDSCWYFIGYEWAEEALKEDCFEPTCRRLAEKYEHDIRTQCGRQQELTL